ncbi:MAG: reverse transcriptase family protein, partial [Sedimenticola sp.]
MKRLVGEGNLSTIYIGGQETKALIDTGSMVSTVTAKFCELLDPRPELHDIADLGLRVDAANGQAVPYLGYVEVEVRVPFLEESMQIPLLVVTSTAYNDTVPVIVGTNIIRTCRNQTMEDEHSQLPEPWTLAFQTISQHSVGVVRTTNQLTLKPMETRTITGFTRKSEQINFAVTERSLRDHSPRISACPRVVSLQNPGKTSRVPVRLCNLSARTVTLPAKSIVCELQEVDVLRSCVIGDASASSSAHSSQQTTSDSTIPSLGVDLDDSALTSEQKTAVTTMMSKWRDIFSQGPLDLGHTDVIRHEIHLEDDKPFKEPYRRVPPGLIQEVREHVKEMLDVGAIRESSSPFSSNVVIVRKKDGSIRFCIDYRKLNSRTTKDAYALPRIEETLHLLAGSRYFSKLDLKSGYWQVELREEDKRKTAFQVGSIGFFEA